MSYLRQELQDGKTVINKALLDIFQDGIEEGISAAAEAQEAIVTVSERLEEIENAGGGETEALPTYTITYHYNTSGDEKQTKEVKYIQNIYAAIGVEVEKEYVDTNANTKRTKEFKGWALEEPTKCYNYGEIYELYKTNNELMAITEDLELYAVYEYKPYTFYANTSTEFETAIANANHGDIIRLAPGEEEYWVNNSGFVFNKALLIEALDPIEGTKPTTGPTAWGVDLRTVPENSLENGYTVGFRNIDFSKITAQTPIQFMGGMVNGKSTISNANFIIEKCKMVNDYPLSLLDCPFKTIAVINNDFTSVNPANTGSTVMQCWDQTLDFKNTNFICNQNFFRNYGKLFSIESAKYLEFTWNSIYDLTSYGIAFKKNMRNTIFNIKDNDFKDDVSGKGMYIRSNFRAKELDLSECYFQIKGNTMIKCEGGQRILDLVLPSGWYYSPEDAEPYSSDAITYSKDQTVGDETYTPLG